MHVESTGTCNQGQLPSEGAAQLIKELAQNLAGFSAEVIGARNNVFAEESPHRDGEGGLELGLAPGALKPQNRHVVVCRT